MKKKTGNPNNNIFIPELLRASSYCWIFVLYFLFLLITELLRASSYCWIFVLYFLILFISELLRASSYC